MPSPAESAAPPAVDWAARRRGPVGLVAPGRYTAGSVTVSRRAVDGDLAVTLPAPSAQTPHFRVHQLPAGVVVQHDLHPGEIDNDLATHITAELFGRGPFRAAEDFEHCLVGLVVTSAEDPLEAWLRFYRNTLRRLRPGSPTIGPGAIADFADIYATAAALQSGSSALDVGCCFGFLAIRLAETWPFPSVTGLDHVAGTVRLLRDVLARLGPEVPPEPRIRPVCADATALPFPDASHDTAYAVHLLEHLEPAQTAMAVRELLRVARRRVVLAVPLENEPDAAFGHRQTFTVARLVELGAAMGYPYTCFDQFGGWLVLDIPPNPPVPVPAGRPRRKETAMTEPNQDRPDGGGAEVEGAQSQSKQNPDLAGAAREVAEGTDEGGAPTPGGG